MPTEREVDSRVFDKVYRAGERLKNSTKWMLAITAVVFLMFTAIESARFNSYSHEERYQAQVLLDRHIDALELLIAKHELRARGLATAFQLEGSIDQERFSTLAKRFTEDAPAILNMAYLNGPIVKLVFPYEKNTDFIGFDLSANEVQHTALLKVQETGKPLFQGPIDLIQGVKGFILRMPVFNSGSEFGETGTSDTIAIVLDAHELLKETHLFSDMARQEHKKYKISLASIDGDGVIIGDEISSSEHALLGKLMLHGVNLQLSVVPQSGWNSGFQPLWLAHFGILLSALSVAFLLSSLQMQRRDRRWAQEQLKSAIEALNDGFVHYDSDDRLLICNAKFKEMYQKCAEVMVPGVKFEDILRFGLKNGQYSEAIGREEEWLKERLAAHHAADSTIEQKLSDGRWLRILERRTSNGGRVGLQIDITEQVESRERAERSERLLLDAINALPAGFWLFDADGKLALFNDYYVKLFEKSAPALKIGATSEDVLRYGLARGEYPEAVGREEEWLEELQARISQGKYEWEYPLQSGRWIRSYNQPTSDGGRVGIRMDITELKERQFEIESSNKELQSALADRDAAEQRFREVSDISNDWFWEQDKDLRFTSLSESYQNILGRDPNRLLGKTPNEVYSDIPEVRESADWKWLDAKYASRGTFRNFIYKNIDPPKQDKWVRISGMPFYDEKGEFAGYRGVGSDITELYTAMRKAETANIAKTEFLNLISHELRTPLTVILGFNAFLTRPEILSSFKSIQAKLDEGSISPQETGQHVEAIKKEIALYAGKMETSGKHLMTLIDDMLDLARIDSGKLEIKATNISLPEIVRAVMVQFEQMAAAKSIELIESIDCEEVFADDLRLRQILINLLGNAMKFTEEGYVKVSAEARGTEVAIHVEDTGVGISEEHQDMIFEQFGQIDSSYSREQNGTGLGLAITRRLVELQGGTISIESKAGEGSIFTFTLPMKMTGKSRADWDSSAKVA